VDESDERKETRRRRRENIKRKGIREMWRRRGD
jgi:hypothetical protein